MSPQSLEEYTEVIAKRYKRAVYKSKKELLNEYCQVTGFHRKHAIRKLNSFKFFQKPKKHKRGRTSVYNQPDVLRILKKIWLTANLPCSKLLKALLPAWLPHYAQTFEPIAPDTLVLLERISSATIDRTLKPVRPQFHKKAVAELSQDRFYVIRSLFKPINGIKLFPGSLNPTLSTIAAIISKANTFLPSITPILPPAGLNSAQSGARVKQAS